MSSAREGLLPRAVATLTARSNPNRAILVVTIAFTAVIVAHGAHWLSLEDQLTDVGKKFFLIYVEAALCYAKLLPRHRVFGIAVAIVHGAWPSPPSGRRHSNKRRRSRSSGWWRRLSARPPRA